MFIYLIYMYIYTYMCICVSKYVCMYLITHLPNFRFVVTARPL